MSPFLNHKKLFADKNIFAKSIASVLDTNFTTSPKGHVSLPVGDKNEKTTYL